MFCNNCGTQIEENMRFCTKCGTPVVGCENTESNIKTDGKEKRRLLLSLVFLVLILVIACLGFGGWHIIKKDTENTSVNDKYSSKISKNEEEITRNEESKNDTELETDVTETVTDGTNQNVEAEQEIGENKRDELRNRDYEAIVSRLKNCEKVDSADRTTMISMINPLIVGGMITSGDKICFNQLSSEKSQQFAFHIISEEMVRLEEKWEDYGYIYNKEELNQVLWEYYYGENIQWNTYGAIEDKGDSIKVMAADGAPWIYLSTCDIREEGDYYLASGPCFYGDNGGSENVFQFYIDALFEKNEESRYGITLCYVETYTEEKNIASAEATSCLADYQDKSYGADKLIDGNIATPWVEGTEGTGEGEKIILNLENPVNVHGILLYNGYLQNDDLHSSNGVVTKVSVDFGNGNIVETEIKDLTYSVELPVPDRIELEQSVFTEQIIITILDAKFGDKYEDTCIGEIKIF